MPKRKAPAPASDWEATEQGTDAAVNHSDSSSRDAQGERERDCEESACTREEAARNGEEAARERALLLVKQADEWVAEHPDAWEYIVGMCKVEAEHKRTVSMQLAAEQIRKLDFASFPTPNGAINNRYRAPLARRLVREHPEVAPFIEMRRSSVDLVDEGALDGR